MRRTFAAVIGALGSRPNVSSGRMFGSAGLKVGSQVFAMEVKGRLVVKLDAERAEVLQQAGVASAFDPGHGRPMKQWIAVAPSAAVDWVSLAGEALAFVGAARPKPARRR